MITIDENALRLSHLDMIEQQFSKLFGELLFLRVEKLKRDDDFSFRYYIEDREGIEGVLEIPWVVYANILQGIKKYNSKYYDKFIKELEING